MNCIEFLRTVRRVERESARWGCNGYVLGRDLIEWFERSAKQAGAAT